MIPEETNPTQTTPEEPLTPTLLPDPESHPAVEPLDDSSFTPPHGDPLGDAALAAPLASEAPEPASGEAITATAFESESAAVATAEPAEPPTVEPAELLYSGPVEPVPAGPSFVDPEPELRQEVAPSTTEVAAEALSGAAPEPAWGATPLETAEPAASVADDHPEPLYAGPVEPAPAGVHFFDGVTEGDEPGTSLAAPEPVSFPSAEPHDDLEAAALASEASAVEAVAPEQVDEPLDGGPNWMLAFICAWSSAISLREAWATVGGGGLGMALHNLGVMGYFLLGAGLLAFAFDALRWGRPRRGIGALVIPTLLTLTGVVCLVLWNDRGRPI